tara:strand:- start:1784 stop:2092 length:309 start_codon:yes stop_codon:yes gene_type:complete
MGASGSNCNDEWEDEMTKDLSRNSAYCAAREAISKQHRGWEKKLEFVGRTEQAWRQARAREARLQDEWVLLERQEELPNNRPPAVTGVAGEEEQGLDCSVMG